MMLTELDYQSTIEAPVPNSPQKLKRGRHEDSKVKWEASDILGERH